MGGRAHDRGLRAPARSHRGTARGQQLPGHRVLRARRLPDRPVPARPRVPPRAGPVPAVPRAQPQRGHGATHRRRRQSPAGGGHHSGAAAVGQHGDPGGHAHRHDRPGPPARAHRRRGHRAVPSALARLLPAHYRGRQEHPQGRGPAGQHRAGIPGLNARRPGLWPRGLHRETLRGSQRACRAPGRGIPAAGGQARTLHGPPGGHRVGHRPRRRGPTGPRRRDGCG